MRCHFSRDFSGAGNTARQLQQTAAERNSGRHVEPREPPFATIFSRATILASFVERNDPRRVPSKGTPASSITGSRRWPSWALAIALLAFAGIGLIYAWNAYAGQSPRGQPNDGHSANQSDDEDDSDGDSDEEDRARLKVKVVHPKKGGLVRTSTQPGVLHAFQYADLYAKASGYLTAQAVDIGDTVERGQLLAEIFDPEVQQKAEEAAAAVEQAKADVELAAARITAAQAAVAAAEAVVAQRQAQVARYTAARIFREKEYIRYIELARKRAVDYRISDEKQDEYESAISAEKEAEAAVKTAQAELARASAELVKAQAELAVARANLRVKEAALRFAQIMADYLHLTSPYDGVITNRNYHRGAFIRSADQGEQTPLLSVARTDLMRVVVYVRDQDVPFLDRGDKAVVRIDALRGEEFRGEVARYSDYEDPANRTMRTEIDLPNPTGRLREGMYGAVTILLEPPTDHLTVPSGALHEHTQPEQGE
ncbi:MAG: hypothetical protein B7Z73_12700, partial [Planctomycetia bacterium 21-64-5]